MLNGISGGGEKPGSKCALRRILVKIACVKTFKSNELWMKNKSTTHNML